MTVPDFAFPQDPAKLVENILANLEKMPAVPVVALQVNRMLDDPDCSSRDLAKIIMMDPMLTTKVLRLCNSAEYGFSRKIATISEAVSILGYKELKRILYIIISHGFLNRNIKGYALERGALWENSLTCAVYARYISEKTKFSNGELVFIGALLRDVGKILIETFIDGYGQLLEHQALANKFSYEEAERKVVGLSHTEIGALMSAKFNLPASLTHAIRYHHTPSQMPDNISQEDKRLVAIIHLADSFTMMMGHGIGIDGLMYPLDPQALELSGLPNDPDTLENLYAELIDLDEMIATMTQTFDRAPGSR